MEFATNGVGTDTEKTKSRPLKWLVDESTKRRFMMEFAANGADVDAEKGVRRAVVRLKVQAEMLEEMTRRLEAVFGPVLVPADKCDNVTIGNHRIVENHRIAENHSDLARDLHGIGDNFEESLSVIRTIADSADL